MSFESGKEEAGATLVEFALLVLLVALALISVVVFLQESVEDIFSESGSALVN